MPAFSQKSLDRLFTCDRRLVDICIDAIKIYDFAVICGHRDKSAQDKAFADGFSKLKFPNSKHNQRPSLAVDLAPWIGGRIPWESRSEFKKMAGIILECAKARNIKLRWGGDFNMNGKEDDSFIDMPHFEIVE